MKKITVISATRRPDKYLEFLTDIDSKLGDVIVEYIGFVNDSSLKQQYKEIEKFSDKVKIIYAPDNFIFKRGFDSLYNLLIMNVKTELAWMLFDVDVIDIKDKSKFINGLENYDFFGITTHMKRGDSVEVKYQLFDPKLVRWSGAVHENQVFLREPKTYNFDESVIKVLHNNIVDTQSNDLKKTDDGFIILEKTEVGTDSDKRNLLYESLTWRIVNEGLPHKYRGWFIRHYELNKEVVDWYYERANAIWG